jgi:plastocyanin
LILVAFVMVSSVTAFAHFNLGYSQQSLQATKLVHAGGGNSTNPVVAFVPHEIKIKAGESVTWDNPTPVAEPHSVSFFNDNKYFPDFAAPFTVQNSTEFQSLVPNSNAEPLFVSVPGQNPQTKTVV